jgi:pimeloyl-ACP methyl ester carboxylesterase
VVALDLPGFGGSEVPRSIDPLLLPEAAVAFTDALGLHRATWLGNSLGGAVALYVAAHHPERVSRLVLVDAAGIDLSPGAWPAILRVSLKLGPFFDWMPLQRRVLVRVLRDVFHDRGFVTRERVDDHLAALARPGAIAAARRILLASPAEARRLTEAIGRVSVPTLVLWGRQDRWIPVAHAARFAELIPGARVVVLEACGHMPQEERPKDTLRVLRGFLGAGGTA